ncbi:hypothetical protein KEM48_005806 [Puccinia striiformis f. sp. tritici PST-130]|nr:hypothetical protein KEM48_005806 [Puccinia striiformis f. sp. tritici PST-130]
MAGSMPHRNQTLSQEEKAFLKGRRSVTSSLWREFFTNGPGKATGYQSTALMNPNQNDWPVLGTAHSGGGERATLYGAAVLHALDARTANSPIRGVYDLASYTTGLSGGSWLLVSMAAQEYPTVPILISKLQTEIDVKQMAGFRTSMIDYWSIALGQHFLPPVTNDNFYSDSLTTPRGAGCSADAPVNPTNLPIQGITSIPLSAPIYEYSPFELEALTPTWAHSSLQNTWVPVSNQENRLSLNLKVQAFLRPGLRAQVAIARVALIN